MTAVPVPLAPHSLPLLGHAIPLLRDPLKFASSLPGRGKLVRIRLGPFSVLMVCDPALTRQVLLDDRTFDKEGPVIERIREVAGDGLSTCPYSRHRRQRRLCQPSFHTQRFRSYAEVFAAAAEETASSWRDGQVIDVVREMMSLTARATMETIFSGSLPPAVVQQSIDDTTALVRGVFRRMMTPQFLNWVPFPHNRQYDQARSRLLRVVDGIIADRRADQADHGDLMSSLLAAVDTESEEGGRRLTDAELTDQVLTFFIGGTETTANTLALALYLLATHQDVADALHAEIAGAWTGSAAADAELPAAEGTAGRVLSETLRLYPPAWLFTRTVMEDTDLGDLRLPAGSVVAVSPYLIQRLPGLYENPDCFDPGRWLGAQPDRLAYLPFGAGARKCIGDRFAVTEASLALWAIESRWRLVPVPGKPFRPSVESTLNARGLKLRVVDRATQS
jgi:cytochrome P450